jgi:hypothetical protein
MNHEEIIKDIKNWLIDFIEVENEFYDNKYAVCPYAKSARLKGQVKIKVHDKGSVYDLINNTIVNDYKEFTKQITIIVCRPSFFYNFYLDSKIENINKNIIPRNLIIQHGVAKETKSKFRSLIRGNYYIIIINKVTDVIDAANTLAEKTDFYSYWSTDHYQHVVGARNQLINDVLTEHNLTLNDLKDL